MSSSKKSESKVLDRSHYEMRFEGNSAPGRKEAIAQVAKELGVPEENIGLVKMRGQSGTSVVFGDFYVYGSPESKRKLHPRYLDERSLSNEEREKLKQERKKAAAPQAKPEAKK